MINRRAFTLVELLVVIAIIGLLSTVAIVSLDSARVKSRNAKRIGDVRQLITAIELAYSTTGNYPSSGGGWACLSGSTCLGFWASIVANAPLDTTMLQYMAKKPTDPDQGGRTMGGYIYNNTWVGANPAPSGQVFSSGVALVYTLEQPSTCELGRLYDQQASYTECAYEFK